MSSDILETIFPVYKRRSDLRVIPGYAEDNLCKLLVMTMIDPAVTAPTITVNGYTFTGVTGAPGLTEFQLVQRASVTEWTLWTGVLTVTAVNAGLEEFTRYGFDAVQGSAYDSGGFMTMPGTQDDFAFFLVSCDNNTNLSNNGNVNPWCVPGYYRRMKEYYDSPGALPVVGRVHFDDLGYVDSCRVLDTYDATATQYDSVNNPEDAMTEEVYLAAWMAMVGMFGPETDGLTQAEINAYWELGSTAGNRHLATLWGREENRAWAMRNLNLYPQWGDHEFTNDIGWDNDITVADGSVPNARWDSYGDWQQISNSSAGNPTTSTFGANSTYQTGDVVGIWSSAGTVIDGRHTITRVSDTQGTIPVAGVGGAPANCWICFISQGVDGPGAAAWNHTMGLIQPPGANSNTNDDKANHWAFDMGPIRIAATDDITHSPSIPLTNTYLPSNINDPSTFPQYNTGAGSGRAGSCFGFEQIDDLIADLTGSSQPFKFLLFSCGLRYMADNNAGGALQEWNWLAQHPLYNHANVDYQRLFTDSTTSLMQDPATNGSEGILTTFSGDLHRPVVQRMRAKAYTSNLAEKWDHWTVGTVGGSTVFGNDTGLNSGDLYQSGDGHTETELAWETGAGEGIRYTYQEHGANRCSAVRVEVYQSLPATEVHVYLENMLGEVLYSRKYVEGGSAHGVPIDQELHAPGIKHRG